MASSAPAHAPKEEMSKAMNIGMGTGLTASACILLLLGISFGNWLKKDASANMTDTQKTAAKAFEGVAILGKGGLIAALVALAAINGNVSYVAKNPTKFMQDALATGGFGAIAAVFLTLTRGRSDLFFNHLIFAFMLFFLYHVCREFAGYFTIFGNEEKTSKIEKQQNKLAKPILIVGGIMALIAIILALTARATPDYSHGIFKSFGESFALGLETIIFVSIIIAGEVIVAKNHGEPLGPAIGTSAIMFTVAHLVLQAGGFYGHLYPVQGDLKTTHVN
jgi:hypothetical protein